MSPIGGDGPAFAPEVKVSWEFAESWWLAVGGSAAEFQASYDAPGGAESIPVHTWWVDIGVERDLFAISDAAGVSGSLGIGLTSMNRPEQHISLGGLGTTTIAAATDVHEHLMGGIELARTIVHPVSLHLGTNIRLISPFSSPETGYSVYGGLSVEIR
jgi:hypothetical protein